MLDDLTGVIAPFTTPFNDNDGVELGAISAQVEWLLSNGVHGLAAGGSTGEGHVLSREEHRDILAEAVRAVAGTANGWASGVASLARTHDCKWVYLG